MTFGLLISSTLGDCSGAGHLRLFCGLRGLRERQTPQAQIQVPGTYGVATFGTIQMNTAGDT
jgi:hypothetical protein